MQYGCVLYQQVLLLFSTEHILIWIWLERMFGVAVNISFWKVKV